VSLHISESVIWNETADGVSLYHTETGDFRTLNATAAQIWVLLADGGDPTSVGSRLALLFAGGNAAIAARIRTDVQAFVTSMLTQGLLEEQPS
jgi:hypothetical protein